MASIIDVFAHVLTPRYLRERNARAGARFDTQYARYWRANPGLTDLEADARHETNAKLRARSRRPLTRPPTGSPTPEFPDTVYRSFPFATAEWPGIHP